MYRNERAKTQQVKTHGFHAASAYRDTLVQNEVSL